MLPPSDPTTARVMIAAADRAAHQGERGRAPLYLPPDRGRGHERRLAARRRGNSPGAGVNMPRRPTAAKGGLDSRPIADTATSGDRRIDCMSTMPIATAPRPWRFASRNQTLRRPTPKPRPKHPTPGRGPTGPEGPRRTK